MLMLLGMGVFWLIVCVLLIVLVVLFLMWLACPSFQTYPASDHYNPKTGRFFNTPASRPPKKGTYKALLEMIFYQKNHRPNQPIPTVKTNWQNFLQASVYQANFVWFGHSSLLGRMAGKTILFDPVFANSVSPVPIMMRRFAPKVVVGQLPDIDVIVYSHAHYDHLDYRVVRFYCQKETQFVVPLGVGAYLIKWGISPKRIVELDWWQQHCIDGLTLVAVPARHDVARTAFDGKKSLWAGWVAMSEHERVYFSGDTSYGEHFARIGEYFGGFDLAFVENGQYHKLWTDNHLFPKDTIQAVIDIKAKRWMPIHWGAYPLSTHAWNESVCESSGLSDMASLSMLTPKIGEIFCCHSQTARWWV